MNEPYLTNVIITCSITIFTGTRANHAAWWGCGAQRLEGVSDVQFPTDERAGGGCCTELHWPTHRYHSVG